MVFLSRSGNAALAARHIANRLGAELYEIIAPAYALGLKGWVSAMQDARGPQAATSQRTLDLANIDTLYPWFSYLALQPGTADLGLCRTQPF